MFGWSILFPFIKLFGTIPITGIFTKTSISIFLKRYCLFKSLHLHFNQWENSISVHFKQHQVIRSFLYAVLNMLFTFALKWLQFFTNVFNMPRITTEQETQIILIITNLILIYFRILVSCVCSKPDISSCCFFNSLHLH